MGPVGLAEFTLRGWGWGEAGDADKRCVRTDVREEMRTVTEEDHKEARLANSNSSSH